MRFVMFTYTHPDDSAAWGRMSAEEQETDVDRHRAWFRKHREHMAGGEELHCPPAAKNLRPGRQGEGVIVTDGFRPGLNTGQRAPWLS